MTELTINDLALLAQNGDLRALEDLLSRCQQRIYSICRRMLGNAADAEDAAQEVLIKITTSLGSFRGEADFNTWAHRIAANHVLSLLRGNKSEAEKFEALARNLQAGLGFGAKQSEPAADEQVLAYEVFVECAQKMLQCLEGPTRLSLILVDICDLSNDEAAAVLQIEPEALRQRVSRARRELMTFLNGHCGLVNPDAPCRCAKQVPAAVAFKTIRVDKSANHGRNIDDVVSSLKDLRDLAMATRLLRQLPTVQAPQLVEAVRSMLSTDKYRSLH